jgi:hypothetical protein
LCHRAIAKEKLLKDRGGAGRKARLFPFLSVYYFLLLFKLVIGFEIFEVSAARLLGVRAPDHAKRYLVPA